MKARRVFAHIAFAFLLLSQQLGIMHAISHISQDAAYGSVQEKRLPRELQCEQCLTFAAFGSGLTGALPSPLFFLPEIDTAIAVSIVERLPATPRAFDSRAPPILI